MTTPEGPYRYERFYDDEPRCTVYYELDSHMFCVVDPDDAERAVNRLNAQHAEIDDLKLIISRQNDEMKRQADIIVRDSAEIERLREALQSIVDMHSAYRVKMSSLDALLDYEAVRTIADNALAQEASEQ